MNYQGGKRFFRLVLYIIISTSLWVSSFFVSQAISPSELLIERLQITGGTGKTDNDFITIYNNSQHSIDLNGLRLVKRTANGTTDTTIKSWIEPTFLNPAAYYTWANSNNDFATLIQADTSSTQTIANDNGIALRDGNENSGTIIDSVGWGNVFNAFIEMLGFPTNPTTNQTLERINHQDTNNNSLDFRLTPTIFPSQCGNGVKENNEECDDGNITSNDGCNADCRLEIPLIVCGNAIVEAGETCDDGNTNDNDGCSSECQLEITTPTEIYINEFIADPVSGGNEWVELFTPSLSPFTLTDWSLEDGAGTKTRVSGSLGGAHKFLVIEKPTGALNNGGDIIILRNNQGDIVDQVTYGDWDDGIIFDNAPTASDPYSVARKQDGVSTRNDSFDFAVTNLITKNTPNNIQSPVAEEDGEEAKETIKPTIVISEIYPNPIGVDSLAIPGEFIEIYNRGEVPINLNGWHIEIGAKEYIYQINVDLFINPKNYITLSNTAYKLPNNGSTIKLFQPGKLTSYQTITYKEAPEGQSWILLNEKQKDSNSIWQWTKKLTPQKLNILVTAPVARFDINGDLITGQRLVFDSSDSETNEIKTMFTWNFGDTHSSVDPYPQHIFNTAGTYTITLTVKNENGISTSAKKIKITASVTPDITMAMIEGNSDDDFSSTTKISINEILPNPSGKDAEQEWLEIGNFGNKTVSMKNWRITTHTKKGPIIKTDLTIKPQSFILVPQEFLPTLGNSNETIQLLAPDDTIVDTVTYTTAPENQSYALVNGIWSWTTKLTPEKANIIIDTTGTLISQAENQIDEQTYTSGTVVSLPGVFNTQYFYLKSDESETLIQIYNSKKLFPLLELNQKITVKGEISSVTTGPRIKIKEANDIVITGEYLEPNIPLITSSTFNTPPYPRLIKINGEVTSKKSPRLIITDEQADMEVYLAKGSKLSITGFNLGDKLSVTGVLELSGTTPRLLPRSDKDIIIHNITNGVETTIDPEKINTELATHTRNNKKQLFIYIIIGAIIIICASGYVIWKYWKKFN